MPTIKDIAPESVFTIELNAGTPGRQGPKGERGVQGVQGPRGETGPKPIRGIDYFTQQDISNMVTTITGNSNSAFNENVSAKTKEFNANVSAKTSAFDNNAVLKTEEFDNNANAEKTDFNLNVNNKTTEFNTNASNKKNEIDNYVEEKQNTFDKHVEDKINEFKEETSEYVTETELENKGYLVESDLNGYAKEEDLFSGSYNDLKDKPKIPSKTSELTNDKGFINEIPSEYVTEEEQNEFIKPYNNRIEENEKDISDLEATIDILTNTNTAKGELVHITDALPLPTFETTADGNVKQETTTGKNLLPYPYKDTTKTTNGITFTDNKDGTITANGTATADAIFIIRESTDELASFIEGTNYILSGCFNDDSSVTYNNAPYYIANDWSGIRNFNTKGTQFTYSGVTFIRDFKIVIKSGITVSNLVFKPMVRLATITDDTYEPYTGAQASPNPEYPQEIEVIEGDLSFKVNGKNLFDKDDCLIGYTINATTGVEQTSSNNGASKGFIKVKPNTTYTFSANAVMSDLRVSEYSTKQEHIKRTVKSSSNSYTFTTTADTHYVKLSWNYNNITMTQDLIDSLELMLEPSLSRTNYEPYKEQIVPLDLKGNFVGAINDDIKDYLVTDKKKYWLVKNVGKVVLDGSEVWDKTYNEVTGIYDAFSTRNTDMRGKWNENNIMSTHFKYIGTAIYNKNTIGIATDATPNIIISTEKMTIQEFKQWLSENNVEVYYQLAQPYTEELGTLEEPIKTFEGVNNIQVLANLDTEIEVTYALDVKKYFENKLAEISAQII